MATFFSEFVVQSSRSRLVTVVTDSMAVVRKLVLFVTVIGDLSFLRQSSNIVVSKFYMKIFKYCAIWTVFGIFVAMATRKQSPVYLKVEHV